MRNLEIEITRYTGKNRLDTRGVIYPVNDIVKTSIPDEDGEYQTDLGSISLTVLERDSSGPRRIILDGDVLRGTPIKHRRTRRSYKIVSLNGHGSGGQTISKIEKLWVR